MRKSLLVPAILLLAGVGVVMLAAFGRSTNAAQNANSSTTTNRNQNRSIAPPSGAGAGQRPQEDFSKNTWELPEDADKTRNPVQATEESIAKGKELYLDRAKGNCIFCHGENGAGNEANFPRLRRKPADISNKERMSSMTDGEVFWKISKGIRGIMPDSEKKLSEEERWHVVNYVRTLAKEK